MVTVGLDPGLAVAAYAVLRDGRPVEVGLWVHGPAVGGTDLRIAAYLRDLGALLDRHRADLVAIEDQYTDFHTHGRAGTARARAAQTLAAQRGAWTQLALARGCRVVEVAPPEAKRALTGVGTASKEQMRRTACALFGLTLLHKEHHVADAIAIATAAERRDRYSDQTPGALDARRGPLSHGQLRRPGR